MSVPNFNPSEMSSVIIEITGIDSQQFLISPKGYGFYLQNFEISDKIGIYNISANYDGQIIDSFEISVIPADISYVKTHTKSWIDGSMSDYSYLQKASLVLNDNYDIPLDVQSPEWFVESAQRWLNDSVNDDSFYDMILFLANATTSVPETPSACNDPKNSTASLSVSLPLSCSSQINSITLRPNHF